VPDLLIAILILELFLWDCGAEASSIKRERWTCSSPEPDVACALCEIVASFARGTEATDGFGVQPKREPL